MPIQHELVRQGNLKYDALISIDFQQRLLLCFGAWRLSSQRLGSCIDSTLPCSGSQVEITCFQFADDDMIMFYPVVARFEKNSAM
ncbi:hypothetical protein MRB53_028948 [Persea americana]|uniref:Uncharacterized protein n=1 Tax=Persea americana TaxID=3435 RepID=A0ACC2KGY7_PERAE|nr:hypothetical protein MRB53_028948 [Persea americana]